MTDPDVRAELVTLRRKLAKLEQAAGLAAPEQQASLLTGFRLVNPGDVVQADDHNLTMTQAVSIHANASARSAAIPAPVTNQLTTLATAPGQIDYWTGTTWAQSRPADTRAWAVQRGGTAGTITANSTYQDIFGVTCTGCPAGALIGAVGVANLSQTAAGAFLQLGVRVTNGTILGGFVPKAKAQPGANLYIALTITLFLSVTAADPVITLQGFGSGPGTVSVDPDGHISVWRVS